MDFNKILLFLIQQGENESAKEIIKHSNLYHCVDSSKSTLLHYSVQFNNLPITQFLLNNGSLINARDSMGNSPLILAAKNNNSELVSALLSRKADLFLINHERKNALQILCMDHKVDSTFCKKLLCKFRETGSSSEEVADGFIMAGFSIFLAAYCLDYKVIEYMIKKQCPVDATHPLYKFTGMHVSVCHGDLRTVKVLLKYGANAKALDYQNASPLRYLYFADPEHTSDKVEILKILLSFGVSPTSCSSDGYFDIVQTLQRGNCEAIRALLQSKLDFKITDNRNGQTVLHYLVQNTNSGIVDELDSYIDARCNVDAVDNVGLRPLSISVVIGNVEMVSFLLSKNAKAQPRWRPPLFFAYTTSTPESQKQHDKCAEILLQHNPDLQLIYVREKIELVSLFDVACETNDFNRIKPVIAQLVLSEKFGEILTQRTRDRIDLDPALIEYFNECKKLIEKKIFGFIAFFELLNCNHKKMERYLNNTDLSREIECFIRKHDVEFFHPYLFSTWKKRYLEGKRYKNLKDKAAEALCKIFGGCINTSDLVIDKIIDYLNTSSLNQLASLN